MLVVAAGCGDRGEPPPTYEPPQVRRVFRPPPGEVRPVPPHAIHSMGVGPYLLGTSLKAILDELPHGPRVVLTQIDGVVDYSLVRTENDSLLIGVVQATGVAFVAVLDDEIARTEAGVGVGTSLADLRKAMGPELPQRNLIMDARMMAFEKLPSARFVLDRGQDKARVIAVVVRRESSSMPDGATEASVVPAEPGPSAPPLSCRSQELLGRHEAAVIEAAKLPSNAGMPRVLYGCFSGEPEAVVRAGDRLVVVGGEADKLRRLASHIATRMVFVAPLDTDEDGRHELAIVSEAVTEDERIWSLEVLRVEAGRLQRVAAQDLYKVSSTSAAWIGASLHEIELLIELGTTPDGIRYTGLFVHHGADGPDTVAPLVPGTVAIRRKRQGPPGSPGPVVQPPPGSMASQGSAMSSRDAGAGPRGKPAPDAMSAP